MTLTASRSASATQHEFDVRGSGTRPGSVNGEVNDRVLADAQRRHADRAAEYLLPGCPHRGGRPALHENALSGESAPPGVGDLQPRIITVRLVAGVPPPDGHEPRPRGAQPAAAAKAHRALSA